MIHIRLIERSSSHHGLHAERNFTDHGQYRELGLILSEPISVGQWIEFEDCEFRVERVTWRVDEGLTAHCYVEVTYVGEPYYKTIDVKGRV